MLPKHLKSWLGKKQEAAYKINGCPFILTNQAQIINTISVQYCLILHLQKANNMAGCYTVLLSVTVYKNPLFTVWVYQVNTIYLILMMINPYPS